MRNSTFLRYSIIWAQVLSLGIHLPSVNAATGDSYSFRPKGATSGGDTSSQGQPPRVGALPPLTVVPSNEATVTDSLRAMGFTREIVPAVDMPINFKLRSSALPTPTATSGFSVYKNIDLVQFEVQAVQDFINGVGIFSGEKEGKAARGFIVLRYGLEDDRAKALFKIAKEQKLHSAVLVTDGPISADASKATFGSHERAGQTVPDDFTNDIRPEYLLNSANGTDLRDMISFGYKLYSPVLPKEGELIEKGDFYITMSALANPALDRKPIMHEKEVVMYILKDSAKAVTFDNIKKIYVMHGTGNWTRVHVNRNFIYEDAMKSSEGQKGVFALKHALVTMETFARSGKSAKIEDIPTVGRQRVVAKDGTFWESAYTDGQFELNQRIADELNILAGDEDVIKRVANDDPTEISRLTEYARSTEVDEVILSHFVITNSRVVEALANLWIKKNLEKKPFMITGGLDAKFVGLRSFGMGALLAGYDVRTPFGRKIKSLGANFQKYVNLVVQLEQDPDAKNIDPDGPPHDRVLWHDKTTVLQLRTSEGKRFSALFTGSYNASNNYHNLERQDYFQIPRESALSQAVVASVKSTMTQQLSAKKKALPLDRAVFVIEMAKFLGQTETDLDWDGIQEMRKILEKLPFRTPDERQKDLVRVGVIAMKAGAIKSRLRTNLQVSKEDLRARLTVMSRFFTWYTAQPFYRQGFDVQVNANEMLGLAISILEKPLSAKLALHQVFWRPNIPAHILEARAYHVYQYMQLEDFFKKQGLAEVEAKFPWEGATVFNAELVSADIVKDVSSKVGEGNLEAAAKGLSKWVNSNEVTLGDRVKLAAPAVVIQARLRGFITMLAWYKALSVDASYKYQTVNLDDVELVKQLIGESMDLLLLKDQPMEKVLSTVRYIISLKGYRDNRGPNGSTAGPLSELTSKAMTALLAASKAKATSPGASLLPMAEKLTPSGGRAGGLCRQAFL